MKQLIYSIIIFLFFSVPSIIYAQQCDVYPADCPHEEMIAAAKDKDVAATNNIIPQEFTMLNTIRNFFTDFLTQIANKQQWKLFEFNEMYSAAACAKQGGISYTLRGPITYEISFLIIVNEDTMAAWKTWADAFKEKIIQQSNNNVQSLQNDASTNETVTKKYMDSADYYGNKKTAYMQQHSQQYATDIQNNNQKGIKEFESVMAKYDKIITGFTDKAYNNTNKSLGRMEQQTDKNQLEEKTKTQHYRDAATLLVHIAINNAVQTSPVTEPATGKAMLPQKKWLMPAVSFGGLLHNTSALEKGHFKSDGDYDMDYLHPTDIGMLFFGSWLPLETQYNTWHAGYTVNKTNTDCVSSKKITCDKIQAMTMFIEGRENNIMRFVQLLDTKKIGALISK